MNETSSTKTESSALADKYKKAHEAVLNSLPHWKKQVVLDCLNLPASEVNDRVYDEFVDQVIKTAEKDWTKES